MFSKEDTLWHYSRPEIACDNFAQRATELTMQRGLLREIVRMRNRGCRVKREVRAETVVASAKFRLKLSYSRLDALDHSSHEILYPIRILDFSLKAKIAACALFLTRMR